MGQTNNNNNKNNKTNTAASSKNTTRIQQIITNKYNTRNEGLDLCTSGQDNFADDWKSVLLSKSWNPLRALRLCKFLITQSIAISMTLELNC